MAFQGTFDFDRLIRAFCYSFKGLKAAFINEAAFRLEVILSIILIPLGIWLGENGVERALLAGVILLVMIVELINSGIEAVVDRISGEHHELSGRAKDVGSAAVLIALINVAAVWLLVLVF
ncbi:MAG: diacylglycerol kinase [Gammaproteobacteria bacterium]|nr:diacylglycerol kinase [Gammaproteobacteria bacterium]